MNAHEPTIRTPLEREVAAIRKRLVDEATQAVGMFEQALGSLWTLDRARAQNVLARDDEIDSEEVAIEEECLRILTLQRPVAREFRAVACYLKVNADIERVGDHACSIAKITLKVARVPVGGWPTSLVELSQRVPAVCHRLLRALLSEDPDIAREITRGDTLIDGLCGTLFDETVELINREPDGPTLGLHIHRIGRDLERVGDLMTNIAEDVIYLSTGQIVRHATKRSSKG